ncbi:MAG: hypothetical protein ACYCSJ_08960 [Acidimicrobiales bacterium]
MGEPAAAPRLGTAGSLSSPPSGSRGHILTGRRTELVALAFFTVPV